MSWQFQVDADGDLTVSTSSGVDTNTARAVADFLQADVGNQPAMYRIYRKSWMALRSGEADEVSGNGTVQEIEGDRVLLESLYEQWESVYFTIAEFEELLDDYAAFLDSRRRPDANG